PARGPRPALAPPRAGQTARPAGRRGAAGGFRPPARGPGFGGPAAADGHGPGWAQVEDPGKAVELTLRLVPDLPVQGRVVDLNGKPIAGATLRVKEVVAYADTEAFLQLVREREWPRVKANRWDGPLPGQPAVLTAAADGGFRLAGAGRERVVRFLLEAPGVQYEEVACLARPLKAPVAAAGQQRPGPVLGKVYGNTFVHAALPGRTVRGVVRDARTGKPIAGAVVRGPYSSTTHRTT